MANVNLTDSTNIQVNESGSNISLDFTNSTQQKINNIAVLSEDMGDIADLETEDISSVVNAINEVNTNVTRLNTYSTDEQIIGKWVDGKVLYKKTIVASVTQGETPGISTQLVSANIYKIEGVFKGTNFIIPLNFLSSTSYLVYVHANGAGTLLTAHNSYENSTMYATIIYTK